MRIKREIAHGMVVMVPLAAVLIGCSERVAGTAESEPSASATMQSEADDEAQSVPIGASQNVADGRRVVTRVTVESLVPATPTQFGLSPAGDLQQISVTLEGLKGTTNVNPLYFTARAADGTTYQAALASVDGQLPAGTVSVGDRIRGIVAFDVTGPPIASIRYNGALGEELARWDGELTPGERTDDEQTGPMGGIVNGDLGLDTEISVPACDGTGVVILYSATAPGSYEQEIATQLLRNPGASYLRTDNSCPSLRQESADGNPIYAVYRVAGRSEGEVCAAVNASPAGSYGKWLDRTTDPAYIIPC